MLKIRYIKKTAILSGWTDDESEFDILQASDKENTAILDIAKPDSDDYEYFAYRFGKLVSSGKQPREPIMRRDILAEIDEIKVRLVALEGTM